VERQSRRIRRGNEPFVRGRQFFRLSGVGKTLGHLTEPFLRRRDGSLSIFEECPRSSPAELRPTRARRVESTVLFTNIELQDKPDFHPLSSGLSLDCHLDEP
jgi:hypothetical protein